MTNKVELTIEELVQLFAKVAPPDPFELSLVNKIDKETDDYEQFVRNDRDELASKVYERVDYLKKQLEMYRNLKDKNKVNEEH